MGPFAIAMSPGDRQDVSVAYATGMGMLIDPAAGATRLQRLLARPNMVHPRYGVYDSRAKTGEVSDYITADGNGILLLGATEGCFEYIEPYLRSRKAPGKTANMYDELQRLLSKKYFQMLRDNGIGPIQKYSLPIPLPPVLQKAGISPSHLLDSSVFTQQTVAGNL